jgi:23S rRNA (adenine2503-C2)-methyltransferase
MDEKPASLQAVRVSTADPGSLYDLTFAGLEAAITADGLRPAHAHRLWQALYREGAADLGGQAGFPPPLRRWVAEHVGPGRRFGQRALSVAAEVASDDRLTRKFLLELTDRRRIETVAMGYPGRFTACVSTQVGCAMGCVFCATGQAGFARHLRPGEIVAQVVHARRVLRAAGHAGVRNLVLLGMGEPLHNYDAVMTALEIITDTRGLNIGPGRISVSTVGVVPGILRMAEERRPYNLAVSLHGATEAERAELVPVSRRWPLAELMDACRFYARTTGKRIFFEWTLIEGKNDTPEVARMLAALLGGLDAHINLIPLNPTRGFAGDPAGAGAVDGFHAILREAGFPCTVRQRRGVDVDAGCGQLNALGAAGWRRADSGARWSDDSGCAG